MEESTNIYWQALLHCHILNELVVISLRRLHFAARKRKWYVFNHAFYEFFLYAVSRYFCQVFG